MPDTTYSVTALPLGFQKRILVDLPSGCWLWQGAKGADGYGSSRKIGQRNAPRTTTHRVVWEFFRGPISANLEVDHVCFTRACVNPEHLQLLDHVSNIARSTHRNRPTHCPKGHEYTPENTRVQVSNTTGHVARRCKTCRARERAEQYRREVGR